MLQIDVLTATRTALMHIVAGLEDTLRLKGIDVGGRNAPVQRSLLDSAPIIAPIVAILRSERAPMSARNLQIALRNKGFIVNYSTLYKTLQREAAKATSAIRRRGGKYQLADSANNDIGTER